MCVCDVTTCLIDYLLLMFNIADLLLLIKLENNVLNE